MATTALDEQHILFRTFLEDHRTYHLVEGYWKRLFKALFAEKNIPFQPFYTKRSRSGRKLYHANPIFDAYFPEQHKLVRIIQYLPEPDDLLLSAYLDHWDIAEMEPDNQPRPADAAKALTPVPELVISLALTRETAAAARNLLRQWIVNDLNEEAMERVIEETIPE